VFDLSPGWPLDPVALFIPAHVALRVPVFGDTLTAIGFDYDWFLHESEHGRLTELRQALDSRPDVVLTAMQARIVAPAGIATGRRRAVRRRDEVRSHNASEFPRGAAWCRPARVRPGAGHAAARPEFVLRAHSENGREHAIRRVATPRTALLQSHVLRAIP
jgi:hypothetical protein